LPERNQRNSYKIYSSSFGNCFLCLVNARFLAVLRNTLQHAVIDDGYLLNLLFAPSQPLHYRGRYGRRDPSPPLPAPASWVARKSVHLRPTLPDSPAISTQRSPSSPGVTRASTRAACIVTSEEARSRESQSRCFRSAFGFFCVSILHHSPGNPRKPRSRKTIIRTAAGISNFRHERSQPL